MSPIKIEPLQPDDLIWGRKVLTEHWGSPDIVTRGILYHADRLPGFKAMIDDAAVGLLTYRIDMEECEVISLNSLREGIGVGTGLMTKIRETAGNRRCRRIWLITTNNNSRAVRFYEKLGYRIAAIHADAIKESRQLKPSIPLIGANSIEIRDEIEMELILSHISDSGVSGH